MSTLVTKNLQIGADGTASNNFTVFQPVSPDGTLRIGNGNSGTTSAQVVLTSAGNVGIGTSSPAGKFNVDFGNFAGVGARFQFNSSNIPFCINALNSNGDAYIAWNAAAKTSSDTATYVLSQAATKIQGGAGQFIFFNAASGTAGNDITFTERMRITGAGNVGIGTSSPDRKLKIIAIPASANQLDGIRLEMGSGLINARSEFLLGTGGTGVPFTSIRTGSDGNGFINFHTGTGPTERMRIDSSGRLLVGQTTPTGNRGTRHSFKGFTDTDGYIFGVQTESNPLTGRDFIRFFNSAGAKAGGIEHSGTTTVAYVTSSDERLKTNIAPANDASELIDAVQVRQFDWKEDGAHQRYGFIAQELHEVYPEAVSKPSDPDEIMGVDYSKLVPMLVKEIQSLRTRVAALESN